jgi:hypothetical protein
VTRRLGTAATAATCLIFTLASDAHAAEPILPGEPRMMREPAMSSTSRRRRHRRPIDIDVGLVSGSTTSAALSSASMTQ